ncbi:MAG: hypothetical protein JST54_02720 [Deltaproteobacteria bacterium]|nr:hypothetical protein [Deltaproteobacteria bacterium]
MADRGFDLKESVIEGFYTVKGLLEQFVDDFRSRDRYFKYKVGVIAAWLTVSTMTLGVSCGGGPKDNSLHAHTQVTQVLDDKSLLVRNDSNALWKEVHLTLNGKFTAYTPEIPAGGKFVIAVRQFVGPDGQFPAKDLTPTKLRVVCSEGADELDLTKPQDVEN